jgi:xylulokinase
MPVVAGIDSSTRSTEVQLRDIESGRVVGSGRAAHPPTTPPHSEQDPSSWWQALIVAMRDALATAAGEGVAPGDIVAVSIAGQPHGLVVLDDTDRVIRPAKLWNDTESAPDAGWLIGQLDGGAEAWAAACGSVPRASFTISKLSWLHRSEPAAFESIARVMLPHDWLTHRLTGAHTTDRGDASGTGYWSPGEGRYRTDLLAIVDGDTDWASALPRVLGPLDPAGALTPGAAADLGLPAGILVAAGTGDNMAGALGVGLRPGDLCVSIATSGAVFTVAEDATADATGAVAGFADATGRFLPLVCTITGLPTDVARPQPTRAAVEGVVCGLLDGIDALTAAGVPGLASPGGSANDDARLLLIGEGARSAAYRQVLADLTGRIVTIPDDSEPTAAGAGVQAAAAHQGVDPITIARAWGLTEGRLVEPDADAEDAVAVRARYAAARG